MTAPAPVATTLEGLRVSWGGVWSGFLIGFGVMIILSALGLAIGLSAADLGTAEGASGLGIGAGVWALLSLLVALFVGAMLSARMGLVQDRMVGALQGALIWALAILGIMYLAMAGISLGTSAIFSLLGGATRAVGSAVTSGATSLATLSSGNVDEILARLDDPKTVDTVAAATGMTRDEARAALAGIRDRVQAARDDPAQAAAEARAGVQDLMTRAAAGASQAARSAQPYASATSWITVAVLIISAAVAVWGGAYGTRWTPVVIA